MVLELAFSGELLMDGSPQDLFASQVGLKHYSTKIFSDELVAGDEIIVQVFDLDEEDGVERIYRTYRIEGLQQDPESLINWMPSSSYRVRCQQISGDNKTISFALYTS